MIKIKIDILGKEFFLKVNRSTQIKEIKDLLASLFKSSNDKIKIFYGGTSICDSLTIEQIVFTKKNFFVCFDETINLQQIEELFITKDFFSVNLAESAAEAVIPRKSQINNYEQESRLCSLQDHKFSEPSNKTEHQQFVKQGTIMDIILRHKKLEKSRLLQEASTNNQTVDCIFQNDSVEKNESPGKTQKYSSNDVNDLKMIQKSVPDFHDLTANAGCSKESKYQVEVVLEDDTAKQADFAVKTQAQVKPFYEDIQMEGDHQEETLEKQSNAKLSKKRMSIKSKDTREVESNGDGIPAISVQTKLPTITSRVTRSTTRRVVYNKEEATTIADSLWTDQYINGSDEDSDYSPPKKRRSLSNYACKMENDEMSVPKYKSVTATAGCSIESYFRGNRKPRENTAREQTYVTIESRGGVRLLDIVEKLKQGKSNENTVEEKLTKKHKSELLPNTIEKGKRKRRKIMKLSKKEFDDKMKNLDCNLYIINNNLGNAVRISPEIIDYEPTTDGLITLKHNDFTSVLTLHDVYLASIYETDIQVSEEIVTASISLLGTNINTYICKIIKTEARRKQDKMEASVLCGSSRIIEPIYIHEKSLQERITSSLFDFLSSED